MTPSSDQSTCPRCGTVMAPHTPRGLCHRCLARVLLAPAEDAPPEVANLRVRCPQCGHGITMAEGAALGDIRCESCGTRFSIVDEKAANQTVGRLDRIGQFEVLARLGAGAFGTVWKARDTQVDRLVAIKIPRHGRLEPAEVDKFLREARAAGQLRHPNIVSVFEVGREDDLIYIVGDYVEGTSLAEWLAGKRMSVREAACLCRKVASALEHAHQHGVIHRDIKPGNILLDAQGEPHLTDFGLARREAGEVTVTLEGQLLGTPAYMSPELARGEAHRADPRTDLYSLGVVLFQLLTGELPFRGNTRMLVQQVIHDEPPSPRKLNSHVPRDLETICLKCLEKEPGQRYASARELGEELDRFLRGEPIVARPIGAVGRVWRWSRRKPASAALTGAVALLLLSVTAVSVTAAWRVATARKAEQREGYYSSIALAKQYIEQGSIDRALEVLWKCPEQYRHWEWGHLLYLCHQDMVSLNAHRTNVVALEFSANNRWLASLDAAGLAKVWDWEAKTEVLALGDATNRVSSLVFSPNGDQLAAAVGINGVQVWAAGSGQEPERSVSAGGSGGGPRAVPARSGNGGSGAEGAIVASGAIEAAARRDGGRSAGPLSTREWHEVHRLVGPGGGVSALAYISDGRRLAAAGTEGTIKVWDAADGREVRSFKGPVGTVQRVAFSPDDKRLVAVAERGARVWDLESGALLRTFPDDAGGRSPRLPDSGGAPAARDAVGVVPSPWARENRSTASGQHETPPTNTTSVEVPRSGEICAVFADDSGEHFATVDGQGQAVLWREGSAPQPLIKIRGLDPLQVRRVRFGPEGRWVINAGEENTARLWSLSTGAEQLAISDRVHQAVFSANDSKLITLETGTWATVWNLDRLTKLKTLRGHNCIVTSAALSRDVRFAATGDERGTIKVWSASLGRELLEAEGTQGLGVCSPDGRWLAQCPYYRGWVLHSSQSGRALLQVRAANEMLRRMAFSPDGRRLATAGTHKTAKVWDVASGRLLLTLRGHRRQVRAVEYSPDGRFIATGSMDATAKVWDARNGAELHTFAHAPDHSYALTGFSYWVSNVGFDQTASRLLTTAKDGKTRVWSIRTGRLLREWPGDDFALHPNGEQIVTRGNNTSLRLWELSSGRLIAEWEGRASRDVGLVFSADGRRLFAGAAAGGESDFGTLQVWDLDDSPRQALSLDESSLLWHVVAGPEVKDRQVIVASTWLGLRQWEMFPWRTAAYVEEDGQAGAGSGQKPPAEFPARVRRYAERYWRERIADESEAGDQGSAPDKVIELPVDRALFPQRAPRATPQQLDLTDNYTSELTEPFYPNTDTYRQDNDLSELPVGLVKLGGIEFDIRGVLQVSRRDPQDGVVAAFWTGCPVRIDGIRVAQEACRLHFLLGTANPETDGTVLGNAVLHYTDGTRASLDLVYGRDVRCWNVDPRRREAQETDRGRVVWTGTNPVVDEYGGALRLYLTTRENPRPGVQIATFDFVSAMSRSAPFLIAVTVE